MSGKTAAGTTFALTATAEEFPTDEEPRPCAYCNPDDRVAEREHEAYEKAAERGVPEFRVPDDVGVVNAEYILQFGHDDGAGVTVPVCDMCLDGVPVEYDGETARSELTHEYGCNGDIVAPVVDEQGGRTIHRRKTVNDTSETSTNE